MPLIIPANSLTGGYEVDNSLRFEDGDTAYLSKSSSGSTGAGKTFTLSLWVKRGELGREQYLVHARSADSQGNFARLEFDSGDGLRFRGYSTTYFDTSRLFRDTSAWYHLVLAVDTDTSGDSNSVKIYVNGVQETAFDSSTNPSTDDDLILGSNRNHFIGTSNYVGGTGALYNGYMAEIHLVDGQKLDASSFGEFDEDSGIWKPIAYTGTYGTNGFYLDFENSGSLGADVSGNGNNFTVNNLTSIDQTTDTPTNNFATMNPLDNYYAGSTFSEGNLKIVSGTSPYSSNTATFGLSSGKWYYEFKYLARGGTEDLWHVGIKSTQDTSNSQMLGHFANDYGYRAYNGNVRNNNTDITYGNTFAVNDIIGVYIDLDNSKLYFAKNGTIQNSGTGISITAVASTPLGVYLPAISWNDGSTTGTCSLNFGNPEFSITSGNSDANGYGNFEYAVPSGYYALCTKNLAEFG